MRTKMNLSIVFFVLAMVFSFTAFAAGPASAGNLPKQTGKMSFRLEVLADNLNRGFAEKASADFLGLADSGPLSLIGSENGGLLVYIRMQDVSDATLRELEAAGADITHVSTRYNTVTAAVDLVDLKKLAALEAVVSLTEVLKPETRQADCPTALTSEGDAQLNADQARATYNVDGSGVTVGVLSDSYAAVTSPTSADDDIATGDLPGAGNPCGRLSEVNVLEDYIDPSSTDEGRAMMQIVHDLAPGASIAFASAFTGLFEFADNIRNLRDNANAEIIVDDVSYSAEPFFQDGPVSVAITEVANDGALYFTSAGNGNVLDADGHQVSSYEATRYRPTTCPTVIYKGAPTSLGKDCHNFNPSGDTAYQEFQLADGGSIVPILQWAEPWYNVTTDLDLVITDSSLNVLAVSTNTNIGPNGTQRPFEATGHDNQTGDTQAVRVFVTRSAGDGRPRVKYVNRAYGVESSLFNDSNSTDVFGPSIYGHSGSDDAMSIAAVPYNDAATPEDFTSHGKFTAYFGPVEDTTPAPRLSVPETRNKPDFAATDGGQNTFFGRPDNPVYRFFGTSAAAPHAAAVAALMWDHYNTDPDSFTLIQDTAEAYFESSAANIPNGGQDVSGAGLVDAPAAVSAMIQAGPTDCSYSVTPATNTIAAEAADSNFQVKAYSGCAWTATTSDDWLSITDGKNGTGDGIVSYSAAANTSFSQRTGTITVAGQTHTVTQAGVQVFVGGDGSGGGGCFVDTFSDHLK